jgi:hypothetical protein
MISPDPRRQHIHRRDRPAVVVHPLAIRRSSVGEPGLVTDASRSSLAVRTSRCYETVPCNE